MHASHYSSLLPELFRHKTTRVLIPQPKVILMDFHGTISERRWEDKVIFPYVKQALRGYLKSNWSNETIQRCLSTLRDESFEQRFRNKLDDAPVISDLATDEDEHDQHQMAIQMSEFLLWQMNSKKETNETQVIERLVWRDGIKRRRILTPIYEDVSTYVREWHDRWNCSIYVISSLDSDTLKLLFENTEKGDLNQLLSGFVIPKKSGDKMSSETYKSFYERLNLDKTHTPMTESATGVNSRKTLPRSPPSQASVTPSTSTRAHQQPGDRPKLTGHEVEPRPILFLTDSGQEASAASQVNGGAVFECVLVNRPGNKRIRTYYLSQFPYIEQFGDISFVS